MGSGKSTVGRIVAEELGWKFVDLDAAVAERAGLSIPEIFEYSGEPYFRNLERMALLDALSGPKEKIISWRSRPCSCGRMRTFCTGGPAALVVPFGGRASTTSLASMPNASHTTWRSLRYS